VPGLPIGVRLKKSALWNRATLEPMRRRTVLSMGVVLVTLPIGGCGSSAPPREGKVPSPPPPEPAPAAPPETSASADTPPAPEPQSAPPDAPQPELTRVIARVGKNHGHVLTVALADVKAGAEKSYDIAGTSGHPHKVTLTADQMKTLMGRQVLRTKSSNDKGHEHRILVKCAPAADPPEWVNACKVEFSGKDEHELIVPLADIEAKADRTYDIQGIAGHTHELVLTKGDFDKLLKGEHLAIKTSRDKDDAHLHVVQIDYRPGKKA